MCRSPLCIALLIRVRNIQRSTCILLPVVLIMLDCTAGPHIRNVHSLCTRKFERHAPLPRCTAQQRRIDPACFPIPCANVKGRCHKKNPHSRCSNHTSENSRWETHFIKKKFETFQHAAQHETAQHETAHHSTALATPLHSLSTRPPDTAHSTPSTPVQTFSLKCIFEIKFANSMGVLFLIRILSTKESGTHRLTVS